MKPEVGMPVQYYFAGALEPVLAWICQVHGDLVDLSQGGQTIAGVRLLAGVDNINDIRHMDGGFCEFPVWLLRTMAPPMFTVDAGRPIDWSSFELRADRVVGIQRTLAFPIDDQCLPGCQPTSQVLG